MALDSFIDLAEIDIRQSTPSETALLAELRWALCSEEERTAPPMCKKRFTTNYLSKIEEMEIAGKLVNFIALKERVPVGAISLLKVNKMPSPFDMAGCWGYVTNVYVKPDYRQQGIGTKLLRFVTAYANDRGYELLVVWPSDRSYPYYRRAGFDAAAREQDPLVLIL